MSYSNFKTIRSVKEKLGIIQIEANLFKDLIPLEPSIRLLEDLEEAQELPTVTEKSKSELLITPILKEIRRRNGKKFTIYSGQALDINEELSGFCDYILSKAVGTIEVTAPLFCLVEAKNRTIEEGYGQCIAEMYAAQLFNEIDNPVVPPIYGCVSTGYDWSFLKLEGKTVIIDTKRYYQLANLPELLGALQAVVGRFWVATPTISIVESA
jgi:hypothetical protein